MTSTMTATTDFPELQTLAFEVVEAGLRALVPGDRDGPVEGDDGGRGQREQLVVEQAHLAPVGLRSRRRLVVQRGDCGLDGPAVGRVVV